MSRILFAEVFSSVDLSVYRGEVAPEHGPGSVAEHLIGNAKWELSEWDYRLEEVFPISEYFFSGYSHFLGSRLSCTTPGTEVPVRVTAVPKTRASLTMFAFVSKYSRI
jgi:hypothetical protein